MFFRIYFITADNYNSLGIKYIMYTVYYSRILWSCINQCYQITRTADTLLAFKQLGNTECHMVYYTKHWTEALYWI